jgi:hypothetical protein
MSKDDEHEHLDQYGAVHTCYHKCRTMFFDISFWVATIVAFPLEHFLWEKVWPLSWISKWMGL